MPANDSLLTYRPCPICSEETYRIIFQVKADNFFAERFSITTADIVKCKSCGLKFTNPVFKPEYDALQYVESRGYNPKDQAPSEVPTWDDQIICFNEVLSQTDIHNKRLLDIGCGEGGLVLLCQKNNIDAHGIELNNNAVERAKVTDISNISCQPLDSVGTSSFGIVSAIHLLEHLHDCRSYAAQAHRILINGGVVVIIVPNYFAFTYRCKERQYWRFPYQHMNGLTSWMLDRLFQDFGFSRIPLRMSSFQNTQLLSFKVRISMSLTKFLGNTFNLFPTKLICIYQKN